jgi:hypothetical protein
MHFDWDVGSLRSLQLKIAVPYRWQHAGTLRGQMVAVTRELLRERKARMDNLMVTIGVCSGDRFGLVVECETDRWSLGPNGLRGSKSRFI